MFSMEALFLGLARSSRDSMSSAAEMKDCKIKNYLNHSLKDLQNISGGGGRQLSDIPFYVI